MRLGRCDEDVEKVSEQNERLGRVPVDDPWAGVADVDLRRFDEVRLASQICARSINALSQRWFFHLLLIPRSP